MVKETVEVENDNAQVLVFHGTVLKAASTEVTTLSPGCFPLLKVPSIPFSKRKAMVMQLGK